MFDDDDEFSVLSEIEEGKKRKDFRANVNRKKLSPFEMDEIFLDD
ncbi:MAG: hypothetical protein ABIC95_02695 [archaeon]